MSAASRNKREGRYIGKRRMYGVFPRNVRHVREGQPLPDGLSRRLRGDLVFDCEGCERKCVWEGTIEEFGHPDAIRLGGCSPRCCP